VTGLTTLTDDMVRVVSLDWVAIPFDGAECGCLHPALFTVPVVPGH
jgi:hypothetical protein